jgi:PHD/YefM family antitoxin component YafN of YafNO toxin-antitoxin module
MREVPATEFTRNFTAYREVAQREPVAVTSHGRTAGFFLSALDYAEYERLKALSGRSVGIEDLSEAEIDELTATRMAPEHDHLNSLLKDK